jgi:lipoprotein
MIKVMTVLGGLTLYSCLFQANAKATPHKETLIKSYGVENQNSPTAPSVDAPMQGNNLITRTILGLTLGQTRISEAQAILSRQGISIKSSGKEELGVRAYEEELGVRAYEAVCNLTFGGESITYIVLLFADGKLSSISLCPKNLDAYMSLASSLESKYANLYARSSSGSQIYSDNTTIIMTTCEFNEETKGYTFYITYVDRTLSNTYLERQSRKDEHK